MSNWWCEYVSLLFQLDGFSMFYNTDPAADSAVASFVTLLAAAEALGKVKQTLKEHVLDRPLMLALFNGVRNTHDLYLTFIHFVFYSEKIFVQAD